MKKTILLAALAVAMTAPAFADSSRFDARQQNQRERIANGVQNGELTRAASKPTASSPRANARACSTRRTSSRAASIGRNTTRSIGTDRSLILIGA
jgi:hypothetical protein